MKIGRVVFCSIILSFAFFSAVAQSNNDILVSGSLDLIKTDYSTFLGKGQLGLEGNYFVLRHFAVGAGLELWTNRRSSFAMGMRWYPYDHVFVRFRGLIGANDASFGGGWTKPINDAWRFEAMGDFYVGDTEFAIRAGISYIIKNK